MAIRKRRAYDVLYKVGVIEEEYREVAGTKLRRLGERDLKKDELVETARALGVSNPTHRTVTELRTKIREEVGYKTSKSGSSRLATRELRYIVRELNDREYLEFEDVDLDVLSMNVDTPLVVNGEERDIVDLDFDEDASHPNYDAHYVFYFEDKRLVVLDGLKSECTYDHGVVLEKRYNEGLWEHWKKDSYVKELDHA